MRQMRLCQTDGAALPELWECEKPMSDSKSAQTDRYLRLGSYVFSAVPTLGALIFAADRGAFAYAFLATITGASIGFIGGIDFMHMRHPMKDQTCPSK